MKLLRCLPCAVLIVPLLVPVPASAAGLVSCSASATSINLSYNPLQVDPVAATSSITLNCTSTALTVPVSPTIAANTGSSSSFATRLMVKGGSSLMYNLFTDSNHKMIFGDGTGGSLVIKDNFVVLPLSAVSRTYPIYESIQQLQNVAPGNYIDIITISVTY